ncbi:MAG: twin-arginine translocation pathway signal protein [Novosphingobium sp. 17-62-19]|uniref:gluconate 2-dehydrogenase subunit 3 family protein n=1 Tax=Novosphingobium sp. 17-62-19 TaxID=1970406 RepID=UPI000BC425A1|nr:gluconate 2-dehydrogenase subunit 3 family protein [Novosphingobium sp. 17-62-19]OYX94900.1 MAG: twin-arginine translocation pathway signal protein [Novosphingobium sp. 35-62-5]OZA21699.1 MAG: twin-arginine translocation pathway signal protein [Novosphingobium sp. 17-62-19]HQS95520.1 gluconate 2-dehydrogenase subunit 3 family protein [Novosphingobium sp.]
MQDGQQGGWNRRDFLGAATLLALALGIPAAAASLTRIDADEAPTDRQRALMKDVSQIVIPRTDTPGAGDVGAGDFVILGLAHGLENARKPLREPASYARFLRTDGSVRHVAWLEKELNARAGGDFLAQAPAKRLAIVTQLDAEAYVTRDSESPWKAIKALILTAYYTSEAGASQELRYEPVPGRFDPDLPQTPDFKAISNDWTAVDFG